MNLVVLFIVIVSSAFAQQNQKLSPGAWAYYGEEFYQTLKSGNNFNKNNLQSILALKHTYSAGSFDQIDTDCRARTCYGQESVNYDKLKKIMFGEIDVQKDGQGTFIIDVYCQRKIYFSDVTSAARIPDVNVEHTWPQSRFSSQFPKDVQKTDMHHLYLADSTANAVRSSNPFGIVSEAENRLGGEGCKSSSSGLVNEKSVYTPPISHRGNVARSMFYFSVHYNLTISQEEESVLRVWHKADPVDEQEVKRHEAVSRYQKVRNPFVDHPEIVDRVPDF